MEKKSKDKSAKSSRKSSRKSSGNPTNINDTKEQNLARVYREARTQAPEGDSASAMSGSNGSEPSTDLGENMNNGQSTSDINSVVNNEQQSFDNHKEPVTKVANHTAPPIQLVNPFNVQPPQPVFCHQPPQPVFCHQPPLNIHPYHPPTRFHQPIGFVPVGTPIYNQNPYLPNCAQMIPLVPVMNMYPRFVPPMMVPQQAHFTPVQNIHEAESFSQFVRQERERSPEYTQHMRNESLSPMRAESPGPSGHRARSPVRRQRPSKKSSGIGLSVQQDSAGASGDASITRLIDIIMSLNLNAQKENQEPVQENGKDQISMLQAPVERTNEMGEYTAYRSMDSKRPHKANQKEQEENQQSKPKKIRRSRTV